MRHQGVHYDTGTCSAARAMSSRRAGRHSTCRWCGASSRSSADDLHANAVRIVGSDLGPMTAVAEIALELGLEVWFSPAFFEHSLEETAARLVAAAEAATPLCTAHPGRVVFVAGSELTLFGPGLVVGKSVT